MGFCAEWDWGWGGADARARAHPEVLGPGPRLGLLGGGRPRRCLHEARGGIASAAHFFPDFLQRGNSGTMHGLPEPAVTSSERPRRAGPAAEEQGPNASPGTRDAVNFGPPSRGGPHSTINSVAVRRSPPCLIMGPVNL